MCRLLMLQLQGPTITPFTLAIENLILGLWQLQQAGQDFRIKEVAYDVLTVIVHLVPCLTVCVDKCLRLVATEGI